MEIQGRVALVTGAGVGIGRAIAQRLAQEGAAVAVADVDDGAGRHTVAMIETTGGRAVFVGADVASNDEARAMVDVAVDRFGALDIVVNNAGVVSTPPFPDAEPEGWMRVLDVNLRGVMLGTYYGIRAMRERGGGAIVNVASLAGIGFRPHDSPDYAASKAGVARFSAALASLEDRMSIRVNCICPDWVDTPMTRQTRARMSDEERATSVPPVLLQPEEIADAAVELIRDDTLAGRVMCCWCGRPRSLLPVEPASP